MKLWVTITGLRHYYGANVFTVGQKITLRKEPDNVADREAIRAEMKGLGVVGYVANSPYTVLGECYSAGRVYDKLDKKSKAKVKYITPHGIICKIVPPKNFLSEATPADCEEFAF